MLTKYVCFLHCKQFRGQTRVILDNPTRPFDEWLPSTAAIRIPTPLSSQTKQILVQEGIGRRDPTRHPPIGPPNVSFASQMLETSTDCANSLSH